MEKEQNKQQRKKKHPHADKRVVILMAVALILIIFGTCSALAASYDKIYRGVSVCGVDLGGKTTEEAYTLLCEQFGDAVPSISVSAEGKTVDIPFADVAKYDFKKTAEDAFEAGRSNFFTSFMSYITPFADRKVPLAAEIDQQQLQAALIGLQAEIKDGYQETTYAPEQNMLVIRTGHAGKALDIEKLQDEIVSELEQREDVAIEAAVTEKAFSTPSADEIYEAVYSEPQDAYYDKENNKFVPHKDGYSFDKTEVESVLEKAQPDSEYKVPLTVVQPQKTTQALEQEMFSDLLATYTTYYSAGNENRTHNVALAASKLNGYIMVPGAVFSYNGVVGERTAAAGYKNATVYTSNGMEDGIGGGICQVSSTLYNTVLYANLEVVSRTNHSYPVSYVPKGQDATVSMGSIDFLFKNNTANPIMLKTYVGGGKCTVSIYGKKEKDFKVTVESTIVSTNPYTVEYEDNPEMEEGTEKIIRAGITGYSVRTVRKVTIDGKTTTENMPSSVYTPLSQKVMRGTKKAEQTTQQPTDTPTDTPADTPTDTPVQSPAETPSGVTENAGSDLSGWAGEQS